MERIAKDILHRAEIYRRYRIKFLAWAIGEFRQTAGVIDGDAPSRNIERFRKVIFEGCPPMNAYRFLDTLWWWSRPTRSEFRDLVGELAREGIFTLHNPDAIADVLPFFLLFDGIGRCGDAEDEIATPKWMPIMKAIVGNPWIQTILGGLVVTLVGAYLVFRFHWAP